MNDYVTDFYTAFDLMDEDLELMAAFIVEIRDEKDKTRPNIINTYCDECKFDLVYKYTSKLCDMPIKELITLKNKVKNKLIQKKRMQLTLLDFM